MYIVEIKLDKCLLERAYMNRDNINENKNFITDGGRYLVYTNDDGFLVTGYSVIIAYKELGIKEIEAIVHYAR